MAAAAAAPRDISHEEVARLEPQVVMKHFAHLMQTPRPSGFPGPMVALLRRFAATHGLWFAEDKVGNVTIYKPASEGLEDVQPVVIQAHIDMVSTTGPGVVHDFVNDPILARLDGDWLKARGTTLGADNGLGVAAILAILEDASLRHGPVHGLFTVEEETTMEGAELLQGPPFLPAAAILINVDSEEQHAICVGCAGGAEAQLKLAVEREEPQADSTVFELKLTGLLGGHSGLNIQQQRGNGIVMLADILEVDVLPNLKTARLLSFTGGNAPNAIPSHASAQLLMHPDEQDQLVEAVAKGLVRAKHTYVGPAAASQDPEYASAIPELGELPTFSIEVARAEQAAGASGAPLTPASVDRVLALIRASPHGVWRLSKVIPGQTDTSLNLGLASLTADAAEATVHFLIRSFSEQGTLEVVRAVEALGKLSGAHFVPPFSVFRGWEPRPDSLALRHTQKAFHEMNPNAPEPSVYSIHAGLECGMLLNQYPNWDCVSIGPLITGAHSIDEQLALSTVGPFYGWLRATVASVAAAGGSVE